MWEWVPQPGHRSIRDIVQHVGGCKYMYENHAFGDGTSTWDDPLLAGQGVIGDKDSAVAWLQKGHDRLRRGIAALDDAELLRTRPHHSGKPKETRRIVWTMIRHDLYHAGEINHIRALHQQNDEDE